MKLIFLNIFSADISSISINLTSAIKTIIRLDNNNDILYANDGKCQYHENALQDR